MPRSTRWYRFGLRMCRDAVDAEDAVQEAFVTLSRDVSGLGEDTSLVAWLFTVVKNACLRLMRPFASARKALGSLAQAPRESMDLPDPAPTPEEAASREQVIRGVREAIATLTPAYREVIDIEGLKGQPASEVHAGGPNRAQPSRHRSAHMSLDYNFRIVTPLPAESVLAIVCEALALNR